MTRKNILAGWAKTGLFPFNPDRVLRDITKPATAPPVRTACENTRPCSQDEEVQTPVTPVSSKGLMSLLSLIKQEPHDEVSRQRHERLLQKFGNAAQTSFARHALDQDHIRFLAKMNNEAKVRRKTRSTILVKGKGEGRVVRFEDLEVARAKRAEEDAAKKAKGKRKRGRHSKSAGPEAEASADEEKCGKKRKGIAPGPDEPEIWRAPVARMW